MLSNRRRLQNPVANMTNVFLDSYHTANGKMLINLAFDMSLSIGSNLHVHCSIDRASFDLIQLETRTNVCNIAQLSLRLGPPVTSVNVKWQIFLPSNLEIRISGEVGQSGRFCSCEKRVNWNVNCFVFDDSMNILWCKHLI